MADIEAEIYTAQKTAGEKSASMITDAALISGKVSFLQVKWDAGAGGASLGDMVYLGFVPAGMTVVPDICSLTVVTADGTGTAVHQLSLYYSTTSEDVLAASISFGAVGTHLLGGDSSVVNVAAKTTERVPLVLSLGENVSANTEIRLNIPLVNSN